VETPIFAWFLSGPGTPYKPIVFPAHCPVLAIPTAPGLPSEGSQQAMFVEAVVGEIDGLVHHVAVFRETPPRMAIPFATVERAGLKASRSIELRLRVCRLRR
jgi:hypothetical protein